MADGERSEPPTPPRPEADGRRRPWHRRPLLVGGLVLLVIAAAVAGVLYWRHSRRVESTDDAFVDVPFARVSPQVAGRVLRVLVDDNQDVRAGDVLVELDPADYRMRVEQSVASREEARGRLEQASAQVSVAEAQFAQARAAADVAAANAERASLDLRRYQDLRSVNPGAVSQQQLDEASTAARGTAAQEAASRKAAAASESQIAFAKTQVEVNRAALSAAEAQARQAELNLSYTRVTTALSGRVARRTVAAGNFVQPGSDLMAVVPRGVYVTANFKETQLALMRPGQPAEVQVDAYPDLRLRGRVDSLQPGSGQAFSVLPAQNATGNWVKVVQRVPVKIVLDALPEDPRRLAPGMSVEVTVRVR